MAAEEVWEAFHGASDHYHNHLSVDPTIDWVTVDRNQQPHERNRVGNRRQLEEYCRPLQARTTRSRWGLKSDLENGNRLISCHGVAVGNGRFSHYCNLVHSHHR